MTTIDRGAGYARALRTDRRRPGPTRRHRSVDRGRAGSTVGGEEAVFGGGKSIRESMAQGTTTRAEGAPDTVITNAIILDRWGIVRADVGIRDGRIVGIGRAGNPDIADGVDPALQIGPSTDVDLRRGEDPHRRRRSTRTCTCSRRRRSVEALATGLTTIVRRRHRAERGLQGDDRDPGRVAPAADAPRPRRLPGQRAAAGQGQHRVGGRRSREQALAGAGGYKVHEDWGSTPAAIDAAPAGRRRVGPAGRPALATR